MEVERPDLRPPFSGAKAHPLKCTNYEPVKPPPTYLHGYRTVYCQSCQTTFGVPIRCKSRFCNVCNRVRAARVRRRIRFIVHSTPKKTGYSWKKLELTVKNDHDLDKCLDHLIASFRRLRQSSFWKKNVLGGVYVIEVTYSELFGWHPHLHIIFYSVYLPQFTLSHLWFRCTSDSTYVYIKRCNDRQHAINYVTKYVTKPEKLPDEQIPAADSALRRRRLFAPVGECFALNSEFKPPRKSFACPFCKKTGTLIFDFDLDPGFYRPGHNELCKSDLPNPQVWL